VSVLPVMWASCLSVWVVSSDAQKSVQKIRGSVL